MTITPLQFSRVLSFSATAALPGPAVAPFSGLDSYALAALSQSPGGGAHETSFVTSEEAKGEAMLKEGDALFGKGRFLDAVGAYQKAVATFVLVGDLRRELLAKAQMGHSLSKIGSVLARKEGSFKEALRLLELSVRIIDMAVATARDQVFYYNQSKSRDVLPDLYRHQAEAYMALGETQESAGDYEGATSSYGLAEIPARELKNKAFLEMVQAAFSRAGAGRRAAGSVGNDKPGNNVLSAYERNILYLAQAAVGGDDEKVRKFLLEIGFMLNIRSDDRILMKELAKSDGTGQLIMSMLARNGVSVSTLLGVIGEYVKKQGDR